MSDTEEKMETPKPAAATVKNNIVTLPKEFGCRLIGNTLVLLMIFLLAFVTVLLSTDLVAEKTAELREVFYNRAAEAGFVLDDIVITGREKTRQSDILQAIDLKRGDNFLKIDINRIKQNIETLPWVRKVVVKRLFFPNILQVSIEERQVRSIWQINEKFYPIDFDGKVINAYFKPDRPILLIVGEGAPENINSLLDEISDDSGLLQRVKVANFISGRRWNLVLDNIKDGITIKLPEENVKKAWKKLLRLDRINGILKRKLTIIDLRLKDKVTVKLKKTHADERVKLRDAKETKI